MSTDEVRDPLCDAVEASLHCTDILICERDERERDALKGRARVRMLLTKSQVGAVMGRRGSTVK